MSREGNVNRLLLEYDKVGHLASNLTFMSAPNPALALGICFDVCAVLDWLECLALSVCLLLF